MADVRWLPVKGEFGIFSDEGMVDGPFYSVPEADLALRQYSLEDGLAVYLICSEHEEQIAWSCEECFGENEEDE